MSTGPAAMSPPSRAEVCVVAIAECFRGDGETLANPIGTIPMIGGRLARASFEPDLLMTDGEAALVANDEAFDFASGKVLESYNPYRAMFDMVWSGKRHVIMSGSQIDAFGNHNFAAIGDDFATPRVQLLGFRGAPGNTIQNATSYWIPNHSVRTFVPRVDTVCGIGYDRAAELATLAWKIAYERWTNTTDGDEFSDLARRRTARSITFEQDAGCAENASAGIFDTRVRTLSGEHHFFRKSASSSATFVL